MSVSAFKVTQAQAINEHDGSVSNEQFLDYVAYYTENLHAFFQNRTDGRGNSVNVRTTYNIADSKSSAQEYAGGNNNINVVGVGQGSFVSYASKGGNQAVMNIAARGNTAAHEFLHLLGLDDRYQFLQQGDKRGDIMPDFEFVYMPKGQVGENDDYNPYTNVMANANQKDVTMKQWDYVLNDQIEPNTQVTIFARKANGSIGSYGKTVMGIVGDHVISDQINFDHKTFLYGYFNAEGDNNISDAGQYMTPVMLKANLTRERSKGININTYQDLVNYRGNILYGGKSEYKQGRMNNTGNPGNR